MNNIQSVFEEYKMNRLLYDDFNRIESFINDFSINNTYKVMEGYLDGILDFEPVTESLADIGKKVIDFLKACWNKLKEWFRKFIGLFSKKSSEPAELDKKIKETNEKMENINNGKINSNNDSLKRAADQIKQIDDQMNRNNEELDKALKNVEELIAEIDTRKFEKKCIDLNDAIRNTTMKVKIHHINDPHDYTDLASDLVDGIKSIIEEIERPEIHHTAYSYLKKRFSINEGGSVDMRPWAEKILGNPDKETKSNKFVKDLADSIIPMLERHDEIVHVLKGMEKSGEIMVEKLINSAQKAFREKGNEEKADELAVDYRTLMNAVANGFKLLAQNLAYHYGVCLSIAKKVEAEYSKAFIVSKTKKR